MDDDENSTTGRLPDPMLRCRFNVVGDASFDPAEMTACTGLAPDDSFRKGDSHVTSTGRVGAPRKSSAWILNSPTVFSVDLPALIEGLLDRIEPKRDAITALLERCSAEASISLHVFVSDQTPIGTLNVATLRRIIALNADLDLDLYVVDDDYLTERRERRMTGDT